MSGGKPMLKLESIKKRLMAMMLPRLSEFNGSDWRLAIKGRVNTKNIFFGIAKIRQLLLSKVI